MIAVLKHELATCFRSARGYLFIGILLLVTGVSSFILNFFGGSSEIVLNLVIAEYALILLVPLLTMHLSDDRKNGTDRLYASLPLPAFSVIAGRYLALLVVFAVPCAVLCLYPLIYRLYGPVNFTGSYLSILCFFLLGAVLLAIGQFISSLTRSRIVSATVGVVVLLILYFAPMLVSMLPDSPLVSFIGLLVIALLLVTAVLISTRHPIVTVTSAVLLIVPLVILFILFREHFSGLLNTVLFALSPFNGFEQIAVFGIFDLSILWLFLSYTVFFVLLTVFAAERKRFS